MLDAAVTKNLTEPVRVRDGQTYWIIPTHGIQAVRFRDPTIAAKDQRIGFQYDDGPASDEQVEARPPTQPV